jgi:hypothetical protein
MSYIMTFDDDAENPHHMPAPHRRPRTRQFPGPVESDQDFIGVDLDGTLAEYHGWQGINHIGSPVRPMLNRVITWLSEGKNVKIFTARVSGIDHNEARISIAAWCRQHIGRELEITCTKSMNMVEFWDDRAVQVVTNTGIRADLGEYGGLEAGIGTTGYNN